MLAGPIFRRELSAEARGRRLYLVRALAAATIAIHVGSNTERLRGWSGDAALAPSRIAAIAARSFEAFGQVQLVVVLALMPALVAGSVAGESARGTLGLLLASRMGSARIVGEKLAARSLMLAGLPVLALLGMLGGVDPARAAAYYGGTAAAAWLVAGLSLFVSVHARSAAGAVAGAYAATLAWAYLPIGLARVLGPPNRPSPLGWLGLVARELARSSPVSTLDPMEVWGRWVTTPSGWLQMMGEMAGLQASFGLVLFALAAWRLRPAYRARLDARPSRLRGWLGRVAGLRGRPRPPCGDDSIGWKERHAPEAAGLGRLLVLVGLGLLVHMTVNDFRWGMPHRNDVMDELFRHGMDPGP
jgi:hypothetical protein